MVRRRPDGGWGREVLETGDGEEERGEAEFGSIEFVRVYTIALVYGGGRGVLGMAGIVRRSQRREVHTGLRGKAKGAYHGSRTRNGRTWADVGMYIEHRSYANENATPLRLSRPNS